MKTATILPQSLLHLTRNDDYHMALGHLIGKDGFEGYTQFYKNIGADPDKFLILDTGVIEGDARPVEELMEKAKLINASEMILNDVFLDKAATLKESYKAFDAVWKSDLEIRVMAVPQGKTPIEWVECAKEMLSWGVSTLGIPKVLTKVFEHRDGRLQALMEIQDVLQSTETHLLGCWESPMELKVIENAVRQEKIVPVRGVDSAIAYAYACSDLRITDDERPQGPIDFVGKAVDMDILQYNIWVWKKEAESLRPPVFYAEQKVQRLL